jgi:hypothetical protein
MKKIIKGKFEVKATPQAPEELTQSLGAVRMRFDKQFEGLLVAKSTVAMMGMLDQKLGSGAYVALERLIGSVEGKQGSFCLQHSSTMTRGVPHQQITVIPDSGTEELKGISGRMTIDIAQDGQHFYNFEYELS